MIKENRISIKELIVISETESRVDVGEMDCLNLCKQEQIPILVTDDWKALPKLIEKFASIKVMVSAFVIRSILNKHLLTGDNAKAVSKQCRYAREKKYKEG